MKTFTLSLTLALALATGAFAQSTNGHRTRAANAYISRDYAAAAEWLRTMPDLVTLVPSLSSISRDERATIHLDLASCYLALGDTLRAFLNVESAYGLKPRLRTGSFESSRLRRFRQQLIRRKALPGQNRPSRIEGALKSMLVPGLGQIHLKHRERGFFFMGATATAAVLYAINRPPADPNSVPQGKVGKDNSKLYLAGLIGIYGLNVLDCLVIGGNGVSLQVNFP